MRTLIVTAFVSADGVMEAPGGGDYRNAGWTFKDVEFDPAAYEIKGREQQETTALLFGRQTYQEFAPVWPTMEEFAEYNAMPRYVVSTTLTADDPGWPATVLRSLDEVAALKQDRGWRDRRSRQRHAGRQPRRRPRGPLPPARVPAVAGSGQAAVQHDRQGHDQAEARGVRGVPERRAEADLRRRALTDRYNRAAETASTSWRIPAASVRSGS